MCFTVTLKGNLVGPKVAPFSVLNFVFHYDPKSWTVRWDSVLPCFSDISLLATPSKIYLQSNAYLVFLHHFVWDVQAVKGWNDTWLWMCSKSSVALAKLSTPWLLPCAFPVGLLWPCRPLPSLSCYLCFERNCCSHRRSSPCFCSLLSLGNDLTPLNTTHTHSQPSFWYFCLDHSDF